jgi:prephenate dehydrogenase
MLGLALRQAPTQAGVEEVALYDRDRSTAQASLDRGAGDRLTIEYPEALDADVVILALPVPEILSTLARDGDLFNHEALVVDTGSAKGAVVEAMRRHLPTDVRALGGHPLVGTEVAGPFGARPEMLKGATFVVTPVRDDPEAMAKGRALVAALGARVMEIDATVHDRALARTSHLTHLAAFALLAVGEQPMSAGTESLVSSGYRDATRVGHSAPEMVAGFLWANHREVRVTLSEYIERLRELEALLEAPSRLTKALASIQEDALRGDGQKSPEGA